LAFLLVCVSAVPCWAQDKVTILYDAFGESKELTKDWGYSALVEHNGKRILFDTGNDATIFEHNVKALGVDLTKLDFVVISHRHADHTTGLRYVLRVSARGDPSGVLRSKATRRDHAVDMGMMLQSLVPGMQHAEEPDLGSEVPGIAGDLEQGSSAGVEEQAVNQPLVLQGKRSQFTVIASNTF
jgi:glyoxylase-like metal-dependent hydrolase (beta-lactamase superfamily II)